MITVRSYLVVDMALPPLTLLGEPPSRLTDLITANAGPVTSDKDLKGALVIAKSIFDGNSKSVVGLLADDVDDSHLRVLMMYVVGDSYAIRDAVTVKKSLRVIKVVNVVSPKDLGLTWEAASFFTAVWFGL